VGFDDVDVEVAVGLFETVVAALFFAALCFLLAVALSYHLPRLLRERPLDRGDEHPLREPVRDDLLRPRTRRPLGHELPSDLHADREAVDGGADDGPLLRSQLRVLSPTAAGAPSRAMQERW
jgi:hypothetical protein